MGHKLKPLTPELAHQLLKMRNGVYLANHIAVARGKLYALRQQPAFTRQYILDRISAHFAPVFLAIAECPDPVLPIRLQHAWLESVAPVALAGQLPFPWRRLYYYKQVKNGLIHLSEINLGALSDLIKADVAHYVERG